MSEGEQAWAQYLAWNDALAAEWFSDEQADLPVYLDVEPEVLQAAAAKVGAEGDPAASLAKAVSATLWIGQGPAFSRHHKELQKWRSRRRASTQKKLLMDVPPPVTALLGSFTIAAFQMGADTNYAANAYYARLFALLGVKAGDHARATNAFRTNSEDFWRALNEYLAQYEGRRGIPTAYALGFRHVGLPQSQALVRATDRARLPGFFRACGLPPGSEIVPSDLERLLDAWVGQTPSPVSANLSRLWKGKARERIAGVVAVELSHWDGTYRRAEVAESEKAGDLSLTALVRRRLGREGLELSFAARFGAPVAADFLNVVSADSSPKIAVIPAVGGRVRPAPGSRIDPESLVSSKVEVCDDATGQSVHRLPRRVVPMHKDELLGVYVEAERVLLAEDALVLVKDELALVNDVTKLIEANGRRGKVFAAEERQGVDRLNGLPEGWLLFTDVQIFHPPAAGGRVELHVLIPLTTARLALSGGLKLPGRVRKWSSLCPPEISAVTADTTSKISVTLERVGDDGAELDRHSWQGGGGVLVVPIERLGLSDGDFEVTFQAGGNLVAQSMLRLRSGATPDLFNWESCTRLVYELDLQPGAVMSASAMTGESELLVDGPRAVGEREMPGHECEVPTSPMWLTSKRSGVVLSRPVVLGQADPDSCLVTGKHYMRLPTWYGGKSSGHIDGVCSGCNLVKRYPAHAKMKRPVNAPTKPFVLDLDNLPKQVQAEIDNDVCLDALVHVGGGSLSSFERVATQADGSSIFVDDLMRTLEVLGHVDVRRNDHCQPVEWEISPAQLAELPDGRFLLTGAWDARRRAEFGQDVSPLGGKLDRLKGIDKVTSWVVGGLDLSGVGQVADAYEVGVAPDAAWRLLHVLPPLSEFESSLTVVDLPTFTKAERFDVNQGAWVPTLGIVGPGAYRLAQSFRSICLWLDDDGAQRRRGRIGSVQLVKHLAARAQGRPLLAHLPKSGTLVVPLGADLPGLYGRVAALCSGQPPIASPRTRTLAYPTVPKRVADGLASLLSS